MPDHIYKKLELTGTSTSSVEDAINSAIAKASESIHNLRWFEVVEIRGNIKENAANHWQVTIKIGFTIDE